MNMKGSLPLVILHTLSHGPKHGYRIAKRGLIEAFEETVKGRTRRCYRLTMAGEKELAKQRKEWNAYTQAMDLLLGGAS